MKGIASMKEAYFKSLLKRVASTAWDSQAGSKHYFCPLVDEKIALQSSGCFMWMNWFAQKDVTGMISVDTDSSAAECAHSFLSRWCTDLNTLCILYRTWEVWGTRTRVWSFSSLGCWSWHEPRMERTRSCCYLIALLFSPCVNQRSDFTPCKDLHPQNHLPVSCS